MNDYYIDLLSTRTMLEVYTAYIAFFNLYNLSGGSQLKSRTQRQTESRCRLQELDLAWLTPWPVHVTTGLWYRQKGLESSAWGWNLSLASSQEAHPSLWLFTSMLEKGLWWIWIPRKLCRELYSSLNSLRKDRIWKSLSVSLPLDSIGW